MEFIVITDGPLRKKYEVVEAKDEETAVAKVVEDCFENYDPMYKPSAVSLVPVSRRIELLPLINAALVDAALKKKRGKI